MTAIAARDCLPRVRWLFAGLVLGLAASARPGEEAAMRVGITLAAPGAAVPAPLPDIRWPAGAMPVVDTALGRFVVAPLSLGEGERYFLESLPGQGFALQSVATDATAWRSRWREPRSGRCWALDAHAIVGSDLLRLRLAEQPC